MTFGSPKSNEYEDIAEFYTNIRHGIRPSDEEIDKLQSRYLKSGSCPLQRISNEVSQKVEKKLNLDCDDEYRVYFANKYSNPNIREVISKMEEDDITECMCIVMEPQYSSYSIGTYEEFIYSDVIKFNIVKSWHDEEYLIKYWRDNLNKVIKKYKDEGLRYKVLFSAHSLPKFSQDLDDTYITQIKEMVSLISKNIVNEGEYEIVWQSASDNGMEWMDPDICDYVKNDDDDTGVYIISAIGFVSDHIEILYDLDIECRQEVAAKGSIYARLPMLNDEEAMIDSMVSVVKKYMNEEYSSYNKSSMPEDGELVMPDFVKKLIEKKGRENVKMPYFVKKMLEKRGIKVDKR